MMLGSALHVSLRLGPVFVLTRSKVPLALCADCRNAETDHDFESCSCLTCHGFYAATTDPGRIAQMLGMHPDGLLALRTGAPSGTVVIDVDPRNGGSESLAALESEELLPGTLSACTGSNGLHSYYGHPGGVVSSRPKGLGPGVDIKADGGYVVVPPSKTSGRYSWIGFGDVLAHPLTPLPKRILDRLRPAAPAPAVVPLTRPAAPISSSGRTRLGGLVDFVLGAPEGERNACLHWAACRGAEAVASGELPADVVVVVLTEAARQVGLTASEIGDDRRGTIGSAMRSGRQGAA